MEGRGPAEEGMDSMEAVTPEGSWENYLELAPERPSECGKDTGEEEGENQ